MNAKVQHTLFDLTQDGLVIGQKLQRIYPAFDTSAFNVRSISVRYVLL